MDVINSIFEIFGKLLSSIAEFLNQLPWGDYVNALLEKIMSK